MIGPENPLPIFRDKAKNREIHVPSDFPSSLRDNLGMEIGYRVLPYRMQDDYSRTKIPITFESVVLENEILKATFLPAVGGRLVSLWNKKEKRELLSRNPVFQPANLALRNAWFSGGIEWNIGQAGHPFHSCSPVFAAEIKTEDGSPGLRLYEYERCKGVFWQIDFSLPKDSSFLFSRTQLINPADNKIAIFVWINIAVPEEEGARVLAPAESAIYLVPSRTGMHTFGRTQLPSLPSMGIGPDSDGTYPTNSNFTNEFFFQCNEIRYPWEAVFDKNGRAFAERSSARLGFRKLFCWGMHKGGRHWQEYLADSNTAYIEIQGGLTPTQVHGLFMPARTKWNWVQCFGSISADATKVHGTDWSCACEEAEKALNAIIPESRLAAYDASSAPYAELRPVRIITSGSGWGALELERRKLDSDAYPIPDSFDFPRSTLQEEQKPWLALLEDGSFPNRPAFLDPGPWMVQEEWKERLLKSLEEDKNRSWIALLHLGVMEAESLNDSAAQKIFKESIAIKPSIWAWRCLGSMAVRNEQLEEAIELYGKAWKIRETTFAQNPEILSPRALAEEYIALLLEAGKTELAELILESLPETIKAKDRLRVLGAQIALALGNLENAETSIMHDFAVIKEGETVLTDIWFELQAVRLALSRGVPVDGDIRLESAGLFPPPSRIDFRMTEQ